MRPLQVQDVLAWCLGPALGQWWLAAGKGEVEGVVGKQQPVALPPGQRQAGIVLPGGLTGCLPRTQQSGSASQDIFFLIDVIHSISSASPSQFPEAATAGILFVHPDLPPHLQAACYFSVCAEQNPG